MEGRLRQERDRRMRRVNVGAIRFRVCGGLFGSDFLVLLGAFPERQPDIAGCRTRAAWERRAGVALWETDWDH